MPFLDVTPNLLVRDVGKSLAFYRDVLGFEVVASMPPDGSSFVFVWVKRDGVNIFLNDATTAGDEYAALKGKPLGGSLTIYVTMTGIDDYFAKVSPHVTIEAQLETKFYGMREFALADPDGYVLTFAEEKH